MTFYKRSRDKDKDRRIVWFNELIVKHQFKEFYVFFEDLTKTIELWRTESCDRDNINDVVNNILKIQQKFRADFLENLSAVSESLYHSTLAVSDNIVDNLGTKIADAGLNLTDEEKCKQEITQPLKAARVKMLKLIINYDGQN